MDTFLKTIAEHYYKTYKNDITNCCFVFPNRRSALYFRKHLSEACDAPLFAPDSFTINELFGQFSPLEQADSLGLIFSLYQCYSRLSQSDESFDDFYHWGETLLSDFNDIDKYLVDAEQLFSNLLDLKSIDNSFDYLSPEQITAIKRFWKDFDEKKFSGSRQNFLESWRILAPLYKAIRSQLKANNKGYEGMIYRSVIEALKEKTLKDLPYKRYVFIGLNAINPCEEALMKHFQNLKMADFHWDYFSDFVKDPQNKAGYFLRENINKFPQSPRLDFAPAQLPTFKSIAVPSNTGQTKIVQQVMQEMGIKEEKEVEQTAVILSDEQLMLPMLHALPESIEAYNITMGFPLKNTAVYALFNQILNLQKNAREHDGTTSFYHKNVVAILHHPIIARFHNEDAQKLSKHLSRHNLLYPEAKEFEGNELFALLFKKAKHAIDLPNYLKQVIAACLKQHQTPSADDDDEQEESNDTRLEREFLYHLYITISRFHDLLQEQSVQPGLDVLIRLLRKHIDTIAVPFYGEPLKGLQIMGILETRTLDFKHLVFLSFNEGVFPKTSPINTFIPHNLRFGFGLPTTDHQDAIFAYHFYRIIQRAQSVTMVYDASNTGMKTGEISRYFPQLKYIYQQDIRVRSQNYKVELTAPKAIVVKKDKGVQKKLHAFLDGGDKQLSASALNDYIDCHLKFYFRKVEAINAADELKENVDESAFGTIFHSVAENLYGPLEDTVIEKELLYKISKDEHRIDELIMQAFQKDFFASKHPNFELKGRYLVIANIIKKYIIQLLKVDMQYTPFTYRKGEQKLLQSLAIDDKRKVSFVGFIDRVDEINGQTRIIDYKTGTSKKMSFNQIEDLFVDDKKRQAAVFQTFIYALLAQYQLGYSDVQPGVYYIRDMFGAFDSKISCKKSPISSFEEYKNDFEQQLKELLQEIFNPDVNFTQTEDSEKCRYCDYKNICMKS